MLYKKTSHIFLYPLSGGQMEIILDTDLKLILKNLTTEQKGTLFDLLLGEITTTTDEVVTNFYTYINNISSKKQTKKAKMKSLGILGSNARWNKTPNNAIIDNSVNTIANTTTNNDANNTKSTKRKEPKENENNLNNNIILSPANSLKTTSHKNKIPTLNEVKEYIKAHSFNVDAETFVDFYESRGWCVGKSEIKNWQATVRMWHKRANTKTSQLLSSTIDDEAYWHEQKEKYWTSNLNEPPPKNDETTYPNTIFSSNNFASTNFDTPLTYNSYEELSSPFTRFIKRIEDNDLNKEN